MKTCAEKHCNRPAAKGRSRCHRCRSRKFAREHPFAYHYNALRNNARRRGKPFTISLADYIALWEDHPDKWAEKCSEGECQWQIDRIDPTKGYVPGNLQILSKRKNVIKYNRHGRFRMKAHWFRKAGQTELDLDQAPF